MKLDKWDVTATWNVLQNDRDEYAQISPGRCRIRKGDETFSSSSAQRNITDDGKGSISAKCGSSVAIGVLHYRRGSFTSPKQPLIAVHQVVGNNSTRRWNATARAVESFLAYVLVAWLKRTALSRVELGIIHLSHLPSICLPP